MSRPIIEVRGLSKRYRLGAIGATTLRDEVERLWAGLRREREAEASAPDARDLWALKDVSFDVQSGEVVGLIGRNGAGKSTLLKILSRITEPTRGEAVLRGHVASLLEVGTGFHPELTGRENIYLNGAILGMKKREIDARFGEIVAFAELEKHIDTPVKRYSSGMYVRLAFAVAAHLDPQILIVDEVLAVGDAAFQRRCLERMNSVAGSGCTVFFVSHNLTSIVSLCSRAILMRNGSLAADGPARDVIAEYLGEDAPGSRYERGPRRPDEEVAVTSVEALSCGTKTHPRIEIRMRVDSDAQREVSFDFRLRDPAGLPAAFGSAGVFGPLVPLARGIQDLRFELDASALAAGKYTLALDTTVPERSYYSRIDNCLVFEVVRAPAPGRGKVLLLEWRYGAYELPVRQVGHDQEKGKEN